MEGGEGAAKRRTGTPNPVTAQDAPEQGLGRLTTGRKLTRARTVSSDGREAGRSDLAKTIPFSPATAKLPW